MQRAPIKPTVHVIGSYSMNGTTRLVCVEFTRREDGSSFWTTCDGCGGGRDYAQRGAAVKHLKRTLSEMPVVWAE